MPVSLSNIGCSMLTVQSNPCPSTILYYLSRLLIADYWKPSGRMGHES